MAASLLNIIMAENNNNNINNNISNNKVSEDVKPTVLHDFLGRGCAPAAGGSSPSAGGGPVSTTSDLGSERQPGAFFEGVPYFSQKPDFSGSKIRYSGSKRSNSDSGFLPPTREVIPQLRPDFPENSHLMKMLRTVGGERPRWPHEDESFMGLHQKMPTSISSSHMVQQQQQQQQQSANASKWDRAIPVNVGPVLQYPPRAAQVAVPYAYQPASSNRFKDANAGSPLMSQSAADEGSRTGIKGSGILSAVNVGGSVAEPSSSKLKSLISNNEPGSSNSLPHQGSSSVSRQMTIFYGGQAHVFDDVHPNKAEVIMTLAGSNGGSWSTSFLPNSSLKPSGGEPVSLSTDARGSGGEEKSEEKQ